LPAGAPDFAEGLILIKNFVSEDESFDVNKETGQALADDLADTKQSLVKLGRKAFQLSSRVAALNNKDESFFDSVPTDHPIFANDSVLEKQLDEFYKASGNYVTLLREINVKVLKLSGRLKQD
jgi:hypothetical protein